MPPVAWLAAAARLDFGPVFAADNDLDSAIQLPTTRIGITRYREFLPIPLGCDSSGIDASHLECRSHGIRSTLREIKIIGVRSDAIGIAVDLYSPFRMLCQKLRQLIELSR